MRVGPEVRRCSLIHDFLSLSRAEQYCVPRHEDPQSNVGLSRPAVWLSATRWVQTVAIDLGVQLPPRTVASVVAPAALMINAWCRPCSARCNVRGLAEKRCRKRYKVGLER